MIVVHWMIVGGIGYLIGSLNPAFFAAKVLGFDIREKGSGNAGASNVVITMGKLAGILVALLDIGKAWLSAKLAALVFPELPFAAELAGICVILGHVFPLFMDFRGGKGLACLGGVILAFDPLVFCAILTGEIILVLIVDYICIVPLSASVLFPVVYYSFTKNIAGALLYALLIPLFFQKHMENLKRIKAGTEAKFSWLWSKDKEVLELKEQHRYHK